MKKLSKGGVLLIMGVLLFTGIASMAQPAELPVDNLDSCMRVSPRPVLMLLTTDWCKYCQLQKAQLKRNNEFQAASDKFYFVEFNAEQQAPVVFHQQTYRYKPTGVSTGIHELAAALSGDKGASYPTWILLDKSYQVVYRYNGVLPPQQLKEYLKLLDGL